MIGWIGLIFIFIIAVSCCCASDSKSSGNSTAGRNSATARSANTYNRGNAHYSRISYSKCPSCGAPYYDGYCEECGYPNVNQGWLGENYQGDIMTNDIDYVRNFRCRMDVIKSIKGEVRILSEIAEDTQIFNNHILNTLRKLMSRGLSNDIIMERLGKGHYIDIKISTVSIWHVECYRIIIQKSDGEIVYVQIFQWMINGIVNVINI